VDLSDINDFAILIDSDDGDFSNAHTHFEGRSIVGNMIVFNNVEFEDDDWFTLAVKQQACPTNGIVIPASVCYLTPTPFAPNVGIPNANYQWSFWQGNPSSFTGANASTYWSSGGTFAVQLIIALFDFYQTNEDNPLTGNVLNNDSDPYDNNLTLVTTPISDVSNGVLVLNNDGSFSYTPNAEFSGTENFSYRVCNDGQPVFCSTAIIGNDSISINKDSTATGNLLTNDTDIEGHNLTMTANPIIYPQNGSAVLLSDGTYFRVLWVSIHLAIVCATMVRPNPARKEWYISMWNPSALTLSCIFGWKVHTRMVQICVPT